MMRRHLAYARRRHYSQYHDDAAESAATEARRHGMMASNIMAGEHARVMMVTTGFAGRANT